MLSSRERAVLEKYRGLFEALEEYDRTWQLPADRMRINITLSRRIVVKLLRLKEETGKTVSRIVEEAVEELPEG